MQCAVSEGRGWRCVWTELCAHCARRDKHGKHVKRAKRAKRAERAERANRAGPAQRAKHEKHAKRAERPDRRLGQEYYSTVHWFCGARHGPSASGEWGT